MDNVELGPASAPGQTAPAARSGRVKRVVTTIAAGVILLGSGAAIGVALTSGASAATSPPHSGAAGPAAAKCAKIVKALRAHPAFASSHPAVIRKVRALGGQPFVNAFRDVKAGAHEALHGDLKRFVEDVDALAKALPR